MQQLEKGHIAKYIVDADHKRTVTIRRQTAVTMSTTLIVKSPSITPVIVSSLPHELNGLFKRVVHKSNFNGIAYNHISKTSLLGRLSALKQLHAPS